LDHIGKSLIEQGVMEPWRTQLRQLAALPNLSCKVSGLLVEAGPDWSLAKIRPYIWEAVDAFGFDRLMFGSDFPVQNLVGDYVSWATLVSDALADATEEERT
jgi:L-fuconolactonase